MLQKKEERALYSQWIRCSPPHTKVPLAPFSEDHCEVNHMPSSTSKAGSDYASGGSSPIGPSPNTKGSIVGSIHKLEENF